ncbi:MAG: SGNH/GDSL hydrolase family protein [Blastocatellia bacterium]|nr:SGNH/GDSL hydrolase family protein [Blastocatellia bacterium]
MTMKIRDAARSLFPFLAALLFLGALLPSSSGAWQLRVTSDTPSPRTSQQARRNIGLFFDKLRAGRAVTIAYLGGSITDGLGASNPEKTSYRAQVTEWLRKSYPKAEITEINAGIAHTGSLYASLRARRDLMADKPDLIFVDFAASDAGEDETIVKKSIEGLLRQMLVVPQPPEVVMLYATNARHTTHAEWHDVIAGHYQVPSVNLQDRVWNAIQTNRLKAADLWPAPRRDDVNPSDAGHRFYAELIIGFLNEQQGLKPTPIARALPTPLVSDELNYGEFKTFAEIPHDATWRSDPINDRIFPTALLSAEKAATPLELFFEGTVVGLSFRGGPDAGILECLIDGKPAPAPLNRIDMYDGVHRIATRIIPGGLGPGEHKLTIRLLNEKNPKSAGANARLGYLLVGGTRPERL